MARIIYMKFSNWIKWSDRNKLNDLQYSGVYAISYNEHNINNNSFAWIREIIYVGMTNSKGGLKRRLGQFDYTICGKGNNSGGAKRVRYKYKDYEKLIKYLYVAVHPFKCDVSSNKEKDLLIMGKVAEYEYICFAEYVKRFGMLPEFNDKKRSPKK
jgi:hypothetical protein